MLHSSQSCYIHFTVCEKKTCPVECLKFFSADFSTNNFPFPKKANQVKPGLGTPGLRRKQWFAQGSHPQSSAPQQQPLNPLISSISTVPGEWDVSCLPEGRDSQKGGDQGPDTPKVPFSLVQRRRGTSSLSSSALCLCQALGRDLSSPRQAQNQIGWVCWVLIVWLILGFVCFLVLFSRFLDHFSWFNTKF